MNNNKPQITIGIPAYNEEANIAKLLKNLISQMSNNYILNEIIIICDGCTDNTVEAVNMIHNKKIRVITEIIRKGQNFRLNQVLKIMKKKSDYLLVIEADELPADKYFIEHMVRAIPKNDKFSFVIGNSLPLPPQNYFEKIMNFGFQIRQEIFENSKPKSNLYVATSCKLFSSKFLKNFKWSLSFHEDSYCYRKAVESGLPIIRAINAKIYFKSVSNIHDYLLQSGKFQKAKSKESKLKNTYTLQINQSKLAYIFIKYLLINPFYFTSWLLFFTLSRIYSKFLPQYSTFWKIYKSTKHLSIDKT